MIYRQVTFNYICQECGTKNFTDIKEIITECNILPFKMGNDMHHHDSNTGNVNLICCNGHQTIQEYISACECGWNSSVKYDPGKLYQEMEDKRRKENEEYERGIANGTIISYDPRNPLKGLNIFQKILLHFVLTFGK